MKLVVLGRWAAIFLAVVSLFGTVDGVFAKIDKDKLKFFARNNILYYDDCSGGGSGSGNYGTVTVCGETIEQKIWTGLTSFMSKEQAAGVMGNMAHEGGFNPARHEGSFINSSYDFVNDPGPSYGIGLIQWSFRRRVDMIASIQAADPSLMKYITERSTYGGLSGAEFLEKAGDDVTNKLVAIELNYLKKELSENATYGGILETTTVDEAANYFLRYVEVPADLNQPIRAEDANKYYNELKDYSCSGSSFGGGGSGNTTTAEWQDGWLKTGSMEGVSIEKADMSKTDDTSAPFSGKPTMIVLHYTAGTTGGLAAYPSNNYYPAHFTIDLKKKKVSQHFSLKENSLATSGFDDKAIQIEIVGVGYDDWAGADPSSEYNLKNFTNEEWKYLAQLLIGISNETGIPLTSSVSWDKEWEKGSDGGGKELSQAELDNYSGVLGHMHLKGNGKSDPGDIWGSVYTAVRTYTGGDHCDSKGGSLAGAVQTEEDAKNMMNQFIRDTNHSHAGVNYPEIDGEVQFGVAVNTPGSDGVTEGDAGVFNEWVSEGLISAEQLGAKSACWQATYCGQCTAFSGWFTTMMTGYVYGSGDGISVVSNLLSKNPELEASSSPSVWSVFSEGGTSGAGHTGVVVGQKDDQWITIENNYNVNHLIVQVRSFGADATFTDVSGKGIKIEHIGQTY